MCPEDLVRREVRLRACLITAREAYYKARTEAERLRNIRSELTLNHSDGRMSALMAARIERHALQVYRRALREFSDFVLGGTPPEQR